MSADHSNNIFMGRDKSSKDAMWNMNAPVLQESADSCINGVCFNQLSAMYENNAQKNQAGLAAEEAQNLTAYQKRPEQLLVEARRQVAEPEPTGVPTWVWVAGGVAVLLAMRS